ncbi:MAG: DUF4406 domain-containing protein [Acidaminococcaceae bacterium]|nr:DUF4406 domain-containing protein [Acidaminococcaceae bacterium]
MKLVYISHPFTGDKWGNRIDARAYCKQLNEEHNDWCIVNPLDMFLWTDRADLTYDKILEMCLAVLMRCDAILMSEEWEKSKGCRAEKAAAENKGMEIFYENC